MSNLSIHKIFMDNVQTIKNTQISNGQFHPDNEVCGRNIGTNLHTMSNYRSKGSQYINGKRCAIENYKKYERITNILADTKENQELYIDKFLNADKILNKIIKLERLFY